MSSSDRDHIDRMMGRIPPLEVKGHDTMLPLFPSMALDDALGRNYQGLKEAVTALYRAAYWTPDRQCDAEGLWEAVRDRAGIPPGKSPKPK